MKLLDLIDVYRYKHEEAVCFLVLSGPYAGTTSPTWSNNCFAVTIKDRKVTAQQVLEIVRTKSNDLNATDEAHAARMIEGTARSMGIEVVR